jgi:hypothetical protein
MPELVRLGEAGPELIGGEHLGYVGLRAAAVPRLAGNKRVSE